MTTKNQQLRLREQFSITSFIIIIIGLSPNTHPIAGNLPVKIVATNKINKAIWNELKILNIPREGEECCRVKEGEGDGKDERGRREGWVVRARDKRQLREEDGYQEEGEVGRRVENVDQRWNVGLGYHNNYDEHDVTLQTKTSH